MAVRSQPYRIQWPLTAESAENIDEMFQQLYDDLRISAIGEGTSISALKLTGSKGDILYIKDTSNTVGTFGVSSSAGAMVRSDGTIPGWSTTTWPNSATTGDLVFASAANAYGNLAAAVAGKVLRAAGASTAPAYSTFTIPDTFTAGSLVVATATNVLGEDNGNLFWDNASKRLGIGLTNPSNILDVSAVAPIVGLTHSSTAQFSSVRFYEGASLRGALQHIGSTFVTGTRQDDLELVTLTATSDIVLLPNSVETARFTVGGGLTLSIPLTAANGGTGVSAFPSGIAGQFAFHLLASDEDINDGIWIRSGVNAG